MVNSVGTKVNKMSEEFIVNFRHYRKILEEYFDIKNKVLNQSDALSVKKHHSRAKLLARERIDLLIDKGTTFLEFSQLAAYGQYDDAFPFAGIVTGIGVIKGRETVIIANDATVKGGTYVRETVKKHLRAQEIALQNHLACVYLVDSGGIYLPEQSNVFPDRFGFGRFFYNQSKLSALGVPQIAVVMGSCTAGGAYIPAMSDEVIMVRQQGTIFVGGPPLVKAATGEEVDAEELGGAEVHTSKSGVADHIAEDDQDALRICRRIFDSLPLPQKQEVAYREPEEPRLDQEEIYGLIPKDRKKNMMTREIILRMIDGSRFQEFKKDYAGNIITGFANIKGFPVGIIANNGFLTAEAARKGTHFIELCDHRRIPLVFFQNITGFIVGKEYEHAGIARDGAKLIHAVSNAVVPRFTIIMGGSYGAGNYAMAGRAFDPHFLFLWPNARTSVMGGEQADMVLHQINFKQQKGHKNMVERFEEESLAYYSTSRIWDDGILDPRETRDVLAMVISASLNRKIEEPRRGIYRM